jgi:excinuclease ABC subunit C
VIDGGKGQLNAAVKSLAKLGIQYTVPVIGIAKRLEELYYPNDPVPLYIDKNSPTLKLIQNIRNEAHRFGINFHRNRRSIGMLTNELESIPGIGKKSAEILLKKYKSVRAIKNMQISDIEELVGNKKAKIIHEYFKKA